MDHFFIGIPHVLDFVRIIPKQCVRETQTIYCAALAVQFNLICRELVLMKIEKISVTVFKIKSKKVNDTDGHTHPGPEHDSEEAMLTITTDDVHSGLSLIKILRLRPSTH